MIITRTPFRISFCGGGSDLKGFYQQHGGCVLSTSINKYMYISVHPSFEEHSTVLKYAKTEIVEDIDDIQHPIFRAALRRTDVSGVEITSTADVPAGTGLGSSSAFTVGLLHALYCYKGKFVSKPHLAEEACRVEIEELGSPIGKQDQYAAALGGLNFIRFNPDDTVSSAPVIMAPDTSQRLEENLVMLYTGDVRSANTILSEQSRNMRQTDKAQSLKRMCALAEEMKAALEQGELASFGDILNESWQLKRTLASGISNPHIDALYEQALRCGAKGGKLLGAGGGGFLMLYCERDRQQEMTQALGLKRMPFRFDHDGTSVIFVGDKYW